MITTRLVGGTKLCPKSNEGRCEALCSEAMGTEATSRGNYSTRRSSVAAVAIAPLQDLLNWHRGANEHTRFFGGKLVLADNQGDAGRKIFRATRDLTAASNRLPTRSPEGTG